MSAPGWYPDPGGQLGRFRYWDGRSWSATTTADPRTPPPVPPAGPGAGGYAPGTAYAPAGPSIRRRSAVPWLIGAIALATVLVVVAVLVLRNLFGATVPESGPDPNPSASTEVCPDAVLDTATPPPPQTGNRVRSGALSYARLPEPFSPPTWDYRVPFGRDVQSQDATVEQDAQGQQTWVAAVLVARLLAGDGFYGVEQGAKVVAECVTGKFYGNAAVERTDSRNQATTVDGRPAWLIEAHLSFSLPDIRTTGETMIIVVVETVTGEAGLFYASIPDTSPQFMAAAQAAQSTLEVDG
ncbi:MAG TPA: DUF2510 domain-containing protein [Propionibacteriaceae bacterium]|nr:DUF2510 domain-containing protein [Propionibacteriaceae bacterium]